MAHYLQIPDVELVNNYGPGGFHPVHIGDTFSEGRYTVVHKLGYGTYSTVWLAKHSITARYVSLKILAASSSQWSDNSSYGASGEEEVRALSCLRSGGEDEPGKQYILQLLDDFEFHGPNGVHRCIVAELLGPSLASDIEDVYPSEIFPISVSKRIIKQIAYGVRYLHRKGVIHGDLHLGNILLSSRNLSSLSAPEEMSTYFGMPNQRTLCLTEDPDTSDGPIPVPPHIPRYVIQRPDPTPILHLCLDDPTEVGVRICDFSESSVFHIDMAPPSTKPCPRVANIPKPYRAPEIMLGEPSLPSPSTDVWAVAVLFHYLLTGGAGLFHSPYGVADELLREMVLILGKLPEPTWSAWATRGQFFDEDGKWMADHIPPPAPSGRFLKLRDGVMDDKERASFETMLRSMVTLQPEKRATMEDVVNSEWFVRYCDSHSS
ncbi:hypothetical protein HYPSUDRAFT_209980 [Hypholoma sublateritium FD-334 SS-4]|uniref:non-specific serine/threonine protein kinase n=1 Tax=Hypholoma sublateritium (strain FD-334 SS-4) TaxID=945553 RepID=A0A0D2NWK5_HYPSF|nr:hypothetical protein HYPSUDRAFT_209980 [Hypholoma sublateritium FD-334 SS-4]